MHVDRIISTSDRVQIDDLDWEAAKQAGLSPSERFVLGYFADVESQTVMYLRDLLSSQLAAEPGVLGFLSVWNYEEYFHGEALAKLLAACGEPFDPNRTVNVRGASHLLEHVQNAFAGLGGKLFPEAFTGVYTAWGASQELTTLRAYEVLSQTTQNPVLAELARRIARQERRHYAWYFQNARHHLAKSPLSRKLARLAFNYFWAPVGSAVKGQGMAQAVIAQLFGPTFPQICEEIDSRVASLPGLAGIAPMRNFSRRAPSPDQPHWTALAANG